MVLLNYFWICLEIFSICSEGDCSNNNRDSSNNPCQSSPPSVPATRLCKDSVRGFCSSVVGHNYLPRGKDFIFLVRKAAGKWSVSPFLHQSATQIESFLLQFDVASFQYESLPYHSQENCVWIYFLPPSGVNHLVCLCEYRMFPQLAA